MLIKLMLTPFFKFINYIIDLLPELPQIPDWFLSTARLLSRPLSIFPSDVWIAIFVNVGLWIVIDFSWIIIEWIYKKIPGVD